MDPASRLSQKLYFLRSPEANKSDFGRALLLGGSPQYPGSILLSAMAAMLSGAGYIALGVPQALWGVVAARMPLDAVMENGLFEAKAKREVVKKYPALLFGNGVDDSPANADFLRDLLLSPGPGTLVVDATGLRILARFSSAEISAHSRVLVLTPHLGEAAALLNVPLLSRDPSSYQEEAQAYAKRHHLYFLLKGYRSLLFTPEGDCYPSTYPPTPGLARAGSGDLLAGFLTGILAYGEKQASLSELILWADERFHRAGERAEKKAGVGLLTPEILLQALREELLSFRPIA